MGCGSSSASGATSSGNAKDEPVVAFQTDIDDEDDLESITPAPASNGRNPKSAIQFAHEPTQAEKQAAIDRSLTLKPGAGSGTYGSAGDARGRDDVVQLMDEPQPFNMEQSPSSSPRMQKSFSNPDRSKAYDDEKPFEKKKHYFPESSPQWEAKEDNRSPVWQDKEKDKGGKREALFPSIAMRPQPTAARGNNEQEEVKAHLPSIYGTDGKPEPVQLAIVALEQKKMREEHEKNMGSLAYIENYRSKTAMYE